MGLTIPDEIVAATHMSPDELTREIAVLLFREEKLTLAQAAKLAQMGQLQFQHLLASRQIAIHYDVPEFEKDLGTLRDLEQ